MSISDRDAYDAEQREDRGRFGPGDGWPQKGHPPRQAVAAAISALTRHGYDDDGHTLQALHYGAAGGAVLVALFRSEVANAVQEKVADPGSAREALAEVVPLLLKVWIGPEPDPMAPITCPACVRGEGEHTNLTNCLEIPF